MSDKSRVLIGRIGAPHGVRGEVLIQSYAEDPQAIAAYGPLLSEDGKRRIEIKVVRVTSKGIVARIAGIGDRNGVEALKGLALYVERSRLPAAAEGEFYRADLIGLRAVAPDGSALGTIVAVDNYGAGDILELRLEGERETELIPFADAFVPAVNIAAGTVTVVLPVAVEANEDETEQE
jgi:16S rRNA processing protein RimM